MIDVSRGLLDIYKELKIFIKIQILLLLIFHSDGQLEHGKTFNTGINAVITSQRAIPSMYMDPKIKNRSRIFYLNANIEASLFKGK